MKKITKVLIISGLLSMSMVTANAGSLYPRFKEKFPQRQEQPQPQQPNGPTKTIPDSGATLVLLGIGMGVLGIAAAKRKFASKK